MSHMSVAVHAASPEQQVEPHVFDPSVDPHIVAVRNPNQEVATPIGIRYLGGLAVINPDQTRLAPRVAEATLYASLGFDLPTTLAQMRIKEPTFKTYVDRSMDALSINFRSGLLQRSLSLGVMVMVREARHPLADLTPRERQILQKIIICNTNKAVGAELYITASTVKTHLTNMARKYHVSHKETLATAAVFSGLGPTVSRDPEKGQSVYAHYEALKQASGKPYELRPLALCQPQHFS